MRHRSKAGNRNMVGSNIIRIRKEKHLAQMELLSKIQLLSSDMNQAKLSRIEGQEIGINDFDLYTIAKALNVTVDELFNGEYGANTAA